MPLTNETQGKENAVPAVTSPVAATAADSATVPGSNKAKSASSSTSSSRAVKGFAIAALALSIAAAAGAAYLWQGALQQRQQLDNSRTELAATSQRIDGQEQQWRQLQRQLDHQLDESTRQQAALQADIQALQGQLASQQKRLLALSTTDRADWLLAEAEYLLRLANQRLLMGKEIAGALALQEAVDNIMVELDDSALYPVRQALAEEMTKLRAAGKFDLEGLYLALGAAAKQADQLQLVAAPTLKLPEVATTPAQTWQQHLRSGFAAAWEKLSHYIQINRRDDIYRPLLSPEYEVAVRQNLRLMFEQAQMAALAGKQTLYQDSLNKAKYWLSNYYTLDKTAADVLVATVDELARQQVEVVLPDISGSLRALKNYLENLHEIKPVAPAELGAAASDTGSEKSADTAVTPL